MESKIKISDDSQANIISFNQDYSLISIGTNSGYKIIQISPLLIHKKNLFGSLSHCELSYRSNLLALIGGGKLPKFNQNKVVIYNDLEDSIENEYKFGTPVLNVKFKKVYIFIVCEKKIYVYNIMTSQNIDIFETEKNENGIIAVNRCEEKTIIAYPIESDEELNKGYVGVKNYNTKKYFSFLAQEESISYMEMDYNGLLLATVNDKGNIIRLHNLLDKTLVYECKKDKDKSNINYICFDMNYNYIGASNNKGIIYLWKLDEIIDKEIDEEGFIYKVRKNEAYIKELYFAKINACKKNCVFCFRPGNTLLIISQDEKYFIAQINNKGGNIKAIEQKNFLNQNK